MVRASNSTLNDPLVVVGECRTAKEEVQTSHMGDVCDLKSQTDGLAGRIDIGTGSLRYVGSCSDTASDDPGRLTPENEVTSEVGSEGASGIVRVAVTRLEVRDDRRRLPPEWQPTSRWIDSCSRINSELSIRSNANHAIGWRHHAPSYAGV